MEHGPEPPHERTWRHPSELAAEEQMVLRAATAPATSRAVAMAAGTLGLVAIAVLVLTITPSRDQRQVALNATTLPATVASVDPSTPAASSRLRGVASARRTEPFASAPTTVGAATALATPIGSGRYAVVSRAAAPDIDQPTVAVVLPSGRTTHGHVVDRSTDAVLVELSHAESGHAVAAHRPDEHAVVTVMADPPITVAFADVDTLEVAEGTPVVDDQGDLVGLCTAQERGVRIIEIDPSIAAAGDTTTAAGETDETAGSAGPDATTEPTAADVTRPDDTASSSNDEHHGSGEPGDGTDPSDPAAPGETVATGETNDDAGSGSDADSDSGSGYDTEPASDPAPATTD